MPSPLLLLDIWSRASAHPIGLGLRTPAPTPTVPNPANRLRTLLHNARINSSPHVREALSHMGIRLSPTEPLTVLFIVHTRHRTRPTDHASAATAPLIDPTALPFPDAEE